jgi:hypothetical protein
MMINNTTDIVETSKRMYIDTFFKHEGLNKAFHDFVNAQSEYTRKAIDTMFKAGDDVTKIVTDKQFYTQSYNDIKNRFKRDKTDTQKKGK